MRMTFFALLSVVAVALLTHPSHAQPAWLGKMKEIRLLSTSYDEVVRMFGTPVDGSAEKENSEYFDLKDGRLWVGFSSGGCDERENDEGGHWDVRAFTVVSISFRPDRPISLRRLKVTLQGFQKVSITDVPGAFIYRNNDLGVEYTLAPNGKIEEVEFYPSNELEKYRCKQTKSQGTEERQKDKDDGAKLYLFSAHQKTDYYQPQRL